MTRVTFRFVFFAAAAAVVLRGFIPEAQAFNFTVAKSAVYLQTNSAPPVLDPIDTYVFVTQVSSPDDLTLAFGTVTVTPPGRPPVTLTLTEFDLETGFVRMQYDQAFTNKAELDAAFPNGLYRASIATLLGDSVQLEIRLEGDHYPTAPFITNYRDAQAISAAGDFSLEWPLITGATLLDTIGLIVVSNRSTLLFQKIEPQPQTGPAPTNCVIPAGTLVTGDGDYAAAVDFHRNSAYVIDRVNGHDSGAFYVAITQLPLGAPFAPYLRQRLGPSGEPGFRYNAIPGRRYRHDTTTTLTNWDIGFPITATQPYEVFYDGSFGSQLFYRVVLLPE